MSSAMNSNFQPKTELFDYDDISNDEDDEGQFRATLKPQPISDNVHHVPFIKEN